MKKDYKIHSTVKTLFNTFLHVCNNFTSTPKIQNG